MEDPGYYMLHYMLSEDDELEVEPFPTLLEALYRIQLLSQSSPLKDLTASIMYMRDSDGELFDVAYFHDHTGFNFHAPEEVEF